jgi:hypothetical protein
MYPKKYTNYKQTNINLMVEFVQTINENGKSLRCSASNSIH